MPPKTINPTGLYITIDGEYTPFIPISPCTIESDESTIETELVDPIYCFKRDMEMTFEMKPTVGTTFTELEMVLLGLCTAEQVQSNNWRKLHNLPMKRRKHESH